MNKKLSISSLILIGILLIISTSACGRSIVTGQVVDAVTGKPIEKAAVYIYWWKTGGGPPGLAGSVTVERAEELTDANGRFKVPKYSILFKSYRMAVYKKGYVCWSSRTLFPTYERRKGFRPKNGMIIKMEYFKEEYSKEKHADFTKSYSLHRGILFDDAIESEKKIIHEMIKRRKENERTERSKKKRGE